MAGRAVLLDEGVAARERDRCHGRSGENSGSEDQPRQGRTFVAPDRFGVPMWTLPFE
jgi:hypothetical protein